jgi:PAS domain S-box-containing protein
VEPNGNGSESPVSHTTDMEFLAGGGEMGAKIRAHNWSSTPLGPPDMWPQSLRSALSICLHSSFPTAIYWGPDLRLLYNDAWSAIARERHPWALGRPAHEVWPDIWDVIEPELRQVLGGKGFAAYDQMLAIERQGTAAETYWNYSFSPIRGESGAVAGIFNQGHETTERVMRERVQEAEAARHRQLFQQAPGFITVLRGPDHVFEFVNNAYERLFGDRGYVGKTVRDAFPELEGQSFYEWLDEVYASGKRFVAERISAELRHPGAPAGLRFLDFIYEPITDESGRVTGIFCEGFDVTSAHLGAQALRESEERLRVSQEAGGIGTFELLAETGEIVVSDQFCRLWGVASVGRKPVSYFLDLIHPEDREQVSTGRAELPQRALDYIEYRIRRPDTGETRWLARRGQAVTDAATGRTRYFGVSYDITARRGAEEELRKLNETLEARIAEALAERKLFADIVEGTDALVQVVDTDFRWLAINRAATDEFERIYGIRPAAGRSMLDLLAHLPEQREAVRAVWSRALAGEEFTEVAKFGDPDRDARFYEMKYRVLRTSDGDLRCAYQFVYDVTERMQEQARFVETEEALRQAQKMELVGQLTGGVAHDFNNLLTVIKSSTDLLKRPNLPEDRRQRYIGAIADTVARAAKLTGQLLAFARRQALRPEVFDVGQAVKSLGDMVGTLTGSRIRIDTDIPDPPCFINADPSQFDTAIVNMAVNARDAMNGEGRLGISVHPVSVIPAIRRHGPRNGDFVAVCIEDTGTGIAPEDIDRIFEPFFTTKEVGQGTGLGLSQVFGFAKQSGGEVRVQSEVGKGTMFVLYLPRVAAEATAPTAEPEPLADGHGTRVLVVEDNIEVGTFATQTLAELGYATTWATNAEEALAQLAQDAASFDIVFSDVVMPGMSGIDLGHEIRRLYHDLPVVLASGYSHVLAQNGTYGFELLHKPYSVEQLSRVLQKAVTWKRRRGIVDASTR